MDIKKKKKEIEDKFEEAKNKAVQYEQALAIEKQNMADCRAQYNLLQEMEESGSKKKAKKNK